MIVTPAGINLNFIMISIPTRWILLLLVIAPYGCKKDTYNDPYYINYKEGREYVQTFFLAKLIITHPPKTIQ